MGPKPDIGREFGDMVGDNRKKIKCKLCHVTTGGITRLKQHIAHVQTTIMSIREECRDIHDVSSESSSGNDDAKGSQYANKEHLSEMEKKELRNVMRES
ncbi:hypothetical protein MIMGU_mgv11b021245mg [Erythranthe guttata]|uniref:BED-type domain-containing protein n=1 Tax=Erythranthe guttata TaxID=4155 RepID=A0A022QTF5_ERYGU|nr:hypothetical protein MIMGU_mgv11b021245mg [Erythranthe guttata]